MENKKFDELQKLYDNSKVGALVQEICEYFVTNEDPEDDSEDTSIEPKEVVNAVYMLFCLQSREQILDEFAIVRKRYPELYTAVSSFHENLLVNMDYRALEDDCCLKISAYAADTSKEEVLAHADTFVRSCDNLSEAVDRFYTWLHSRSR